MKTMIVYASHHHGSTRKLVEVFAERGADLLDAESGAAANLQEYDLICFASGIDFGKFYPAVTQIANALPAGKRVCALYTCARDNEKYGEEIAKIAGERKCTYLGKFGCRGYNTYGPWKIIGGMNKGHPDPAELEAALKFYENITKE